MPATNLPPTPAPVGVDLHWLPLGAGDNTHCVRTNGRLFELVTSRWERRPGCDLYHSALEVRLGSERYAIEMAPEWSGGPARPVPVATGPVGTRWLGRYRLFRYEVRCSRDGVIPDLEHAVESPRRIDTDHLRVELLLALPGEFPTATWGRDELGAGEMWNSNSLVSWLLTRSGHDLATVRPPVHGRAPGWQAGLVVASRSAGPIAGSGPRGPARAGTRRPESGPGSPLASPR